MSLKICFSSNRLHSFTVHWKSKCDGYVGSGRAFLLARRRSLRWPWVLWRQRCGERWVDGGKKKNMVEILQCGVRVMKRYAPPITRSSTSSLATRCISHRGFFPDWTVELSLNEVREGVDVISSVNQSDPSVLLARVPIGVRLECIRKINSFKELAVATTRPSSGARRYNGCICRKWT